MINDAEADFKRRMHIKSIDIACLKVKSDDEAVLLGFSDKIYQWLIKDL